MTCLSHLKSCANTRSQFGDLFKQQNLSSLPLTCQHSCCPGPSAHLQALGRYLLTLTLPSFYMQYIWWEWRIVHRSITLLIWKSREFPGHKTWGIQKQNKKTTANAKVEIWLWIIAKCDGHLYVFILFLSCTFYFEYNNHSIILKCTLHSVPAVFFTRVWPQTKISADRCGTDRMCFFAAALGTLHTSVMI